MAAEARIPGFHCFGLPSHQLMGLIHERGMIQHTKKERNWTGSIFSNWTIKKSRPLDLCWRLSKVWWSGSYKKLYISWRSPLWCLNCYRFITSNLQWMPFKIWLLWCLWSALDHHLELNDYGPHYLKATQNVERKWGEWWWVDEHQGWLSGGFALRCWTWKRLAWDMGLTEESLWRKASEWPRMHGSLVSRLDEK